jgi:hypothetical protein
MKRYEMCSRGSALKLIRGSRVSSKKRKNFLVPYKQGVVCC